MLDFDSFDYFENLFAAGLVVVPLFYLLPWVRARRILLALVGMYLIYLIAPRLLVLYIGFWAVVLAMQWLVGCVTTPAWRRVAFAVAVAATLAPMVTWKLRSTWFTIRFNVELNEFVDDLWPWVGAVDRIRPIILPVGLSFATFRAIDLLVKVYFEITRPLSPAHLAAVGFFPPVQVIGPVIEHTEIEPSLTTRLRANPADILAGVLQIAIGAVRVFVVAYALKSSSEVLTRFDEIAPWEAWAELFLFVLYFYFNFAGFSDMAIGSARLFGSRLRPNFNGPFLKTNPQDFWNNWHMSLTRFAQRNVFVPLGGMRRERQYVALVATMMVVALWHDLTIPLVLFGAYHSAGLVGHRLLRARRGAPSDEAVAVRLAKIGSLFVYVALSFPLLLLQLDDLDDFYGRLFGIG
jgi:D-alanyl-lipoteichoic acid acyltransferase DltB (MBOAT superfamily)